MRGFLPPSQRSDGRPLQKDKPENLRGWAGGASIYRRISSAFLCGVFWGQNPELSFTPDDFKWIWRYCWCVFVEAQHRPCCYLLFVRTAQVFYALTFPATRSLNHYLLCNDTIIRIIHCTYEHSVFYPRLQQKSKTLQNSIILLIIFQNNWVFWQRLIACSSALKSHVYSLWSQF